MPRSIACLVILFTSSLLLSAQPEKPKLGLVLSGGGAKGMAHIGVIRVLESQGIYPDYVTGTSMGALVGALYSIGYTPDEMEEIVTAVNWDQLLTNSVPLGDVTIEEKPYAGRYLVELGMEKGKISIPRGLIEGQKLNELFSRKTRSVHNIQNFDQFPIPFACVATDISTGEVVLLDKAFLPDAMRASMAIPSFFTPVEIDGRLLVDGGLVRNFPVEEVRAMGADVVIGVFVGGDLKPKEKLTNMVDVLSQSAFIFSAFDTREQIKKVDLLIRPEFEDGYTQSFEKSEEIIKMGEKFALSVLDSIQHFKKSRLSGKSMGPVKPLPQLNEYEIDTIKVEGNNRVHSEFILGKLNMDTEGVMSVDDIEERIDLLYGTRHFTKIGYSLEQVDDKNELILKVKEAPQNKISGAIHYDTENKIGMNVNLTIRNFMLPNSRWVAEGDIAESPRLDASIFQYLGRKQKNAIMIGFNWAHLSLPGFDSLGIKNSLYNTNYLKYYLQWQRANHQDYTYGIQVSGDWSNLRSKVADPANPVFEKVRLRNSAVSVFYKLNTLDRPYFTQRGVQFLADAKYKFEIHNSADVRQTGVPGTTEVQFAANEFYQINVAFRGFFQLSQKWVFSVQAKTVLSDMKLNTLNLTDYQFIGGFNPRFVQAHTYWGGSDKAYYATSFGLSSVMLQYEFSKDFYLHGLLNYIDSEYPVRLLGMTYDQANFGGESRRTGFGLGAGYKSQFGPMMLTLAKDTNGGSWQGYFNIGFYF